MKRRALVLAAAPLLAACDWRRASQDAVKPALDPAEPGATGATSSTSRRFFLVEVTRLARLEGPAAQLAVSACLWHVNQDGALYGDHWGWCEDYKLLPDASPGYLLLTTLFAGGASGGYARLLVLPPLPAEVDAFGQPLRLTVEGTLVHLERRGDRASLSPAQSAPLGGEDALVEPPEDTGHFEPGFDRPIPARVTYTATHHGWLDSRRLAGRRA